MPAFWNRNSRRRVVGASIIILLIIAGLIWSGFKSDGGVHVNEASEKEEHAGITIVETQDRVSQYKKFEIQLELSAAVENPYDPQEVDLGAVFISPSGARWSINGFYDGQRWLIRFAADETGEWRYQAQLTTKQGRYEHEQLSFIVEPSEARGGLTVPDAEGGRFLVHRDGTPFFAAPIAYPWQVQEARLDQIADAGGNIITYWNGNYDRSGNGGGIEQLESFQTGPGRYDMKKAQRIDEVLEWLEERDMLMTFVIWPHDSLAHKINWPATWPQGAYSQLGEAVEFYGHEEMWSYQEKMYRYIIARWGHSPSLGIWDLICEVNGTDGWMLGDPDQADNWLRQIDAYFKENDPYRHPTMGSMAGNRQDYWDFAYKLLDIADRENYYDTHYAAYAEDVQLRFKSYAKPIWIGETGNVTDRKVYHQAIWSAFSNGLAGLPTWWMEEHMDEGMLESMKYAVRFAKELDLVEARIPTLAESIWETRKRRAALNLLQFDTYSSWLLPDWAEANKDESGTLYSLNSSEEDEGLTVHTQMRFATGSYAQGVLEGIPAEQDWSGYEQLELELKVDYASEALEEKNSLLEQLKAKVVLYPDGQWLEAHDDQAVIVEQGKWIKLSVPLNAAASYWQEGQMNSEQLQQMGRIGIKLYTIASREEARPVNVSLRSVKLVAEQAPVQQVKQMEGFLMKGESSSYGWAISEERALAEEQLVFKDWGTASVEVTWFNPWSGEVMEQQIAEPDVIGTLTLQVPSGYEQQDIAFKLNRN